MTSLSRIVITPGEPAGIGPDIVAQIAQLAWQAELIVVADPALLQTRAKQLGLPLTLVPADLSAPASAHQPGQLKIIPVTMKAAAIPGQLNVENAGYVVRCLEIATDACLNKMCDALVTGPVNKSIINEAKIPFTGHTEFLAERCQVSQAVMLFVVDSLKVALATVHIPLSAVPNAITTAGLTQTLRLLQQELQKKFGLNRPRILVCGLNPHAGENGHLGREEIDIITPALQTLQSEGMDVVGPLPADTIFTPERLNKADAVLAMYHDQALPVVKYMGFNHAVNVTLGLPIIRTSVDHGTALDIAGSNQADPGSLAAAIRLAMQITPENASLSS